MSLFGIFLAVLAALQVDQIIYDLRRGNEDNLPPSVSIGIDKNAIEELIKKIKEDKNDK